MASNTPLHISRLSYLFFIIIFAVILFLDTKNNTFNFLRTAQASLVITTNLLSNETKKFIDSLFITQKSYKIKAKELSELQDNYDSLLASNFVTTSNASVIDAEANSMNLHAAKIKYFDAYRYSCCGVHEMLISASGYEFKPVVNASGLIGQIVSNQESFGTLMLLSNSKHSLPVFIDSVYCNAFGKGVPMKVYCNIEVDQMNNFIFPGQLVSTSGLGGIFPRGLKVGIVSEITNLGEVFEISIDLTADPRISPNIYVVDNK
ncbi:MAG: rod shape-determining protein MreC [Gammaproteobacteria bacterium]